MEGRIDSLKKKTVAPGYADKTPAAVRADDADKLAKAEAELAAATQASADMKKLLEE